LTYQINYHYREMLRRARYCYGKLSISVHNGVVSWSHRLEFFEDNFTVS